MSDIATNILAELKTSTNKTATAQAVLSSFGASSTGSIGQADFQKVFAEVQLEQPAQSYSANAPTTFSTKRTIFECMLYPSYSTNYAAAQYQASEMLKSLDANSDGSVSLAELEAYGAQTTPATTATGQGSSTGSGSTSTSSGSATGSTSATASASTPTFISMSLTTVASVAETASATTFANTMLTTFDTAGNGYFTLNDVQSAYANDPALGDASQAQSVISQFDVNGDGQVTKQELVTGYQQMDIASNLLGAYDPNGAGYIDLTSATAQIAGVSPSLAAMLKSWDSDNNGQLTNAELISGIQASSMSLSEMSALVSSVNASVEAQTSMSKYDTANKGYIVAADLTSASSGNQSSADLTAAQNAIAAWDENGNGQVNLGEMINGQQVTDVANQILSQFDPGQQGYIDLSAAGVSAMSAAPNFVNLLKSWDADNNGELTQQEIMNGLQTSNVKYQIQAKQQNASTSTDAASQAVSLLSAVDTNYDGQINLGEFLNFAGSDASISSDPISTFNAWDTNKDGYLTLDELQTGIQTIQQAQSIVSQYDTSGKGYFDAADLEAALSSADPTQSSTDVAAQAQQIMNFWDADANGKVTVQEVIQGVKSGGYVGGQQLVSSSSASTQT